MPTFSDITDVRLIPVHEVTVNAATLTNIKFQCLEADSNWRLVPITQPNDRGGLTVVARKLEATMVIPFTNYETLLGIFEALDLQVITSAELHLKAAEGQTAGGEMKLGFDGTSGWVTDYHVTWSIESTEQRGRLTLEITGLYSVDIITKRNAEGESAKAHFTEISGWS